ncbi:MAG: hypothetical protein U1A22_01860 [Xanthomonadaceae bacterium]|nr:hypothetical protein [Xanthomonadaceae bacterium]
MSNGPSSAGDISIRAEITVDNSLNLYVSSHYGEFQLEDAAKKPHLKTITVTHYAGGVEFGQFKDYFFVCLFVGERKRVNLGSDDRPHYTWSFDRMVFTFTPGKYDLEIQAHDGTLHITNCDPGSGN